MRGSVPSADRYHMPYLLRNDTPRVWKLPGEDHDHSFCPKNADELQDDAGQALLKSRLQRVWRQWNANKNEAFLKGTIRPLELPKTRGEKFALTILSCGGYMSPYVIDVSNPDAPNLDTLSEKEFARMRKVSRPILERDLDGDRRVGSNSHAKLVIRTFFTQYFAEQKLTHLEPQIDEFLHTKKQHRLADLSRIIITDAIELAVEPIRPIFAEALDEGLLTGEATDPAEVVEFVFPSRRWAEQHDVLRGGLAYAA